MPDVPTLVDPAPDGPTVTLRALRADDVEGVWEQCQDPESQRWTTVPVPYSRDDAREFVEEFAPRRWAEGASWLFAVDVDGRFAGSVDLRRLGDGRAEVGYGAHPAARGHGVMERALRLLLDWGFDEQGVRVVSWWAHVGNWASRKLAWRLGFSCDGTLRGWQPQRGDLHDTWVGLLHADDPRSPTTPWLEPVETEADGLLLRAWRPDDAARVVEGINDPECARWLGQYPTPYTLDHARAWLEGTTARLATGEAVNWAVVDPAAPDRVLGSVGWFGRVPGVVVEMGYWTHPEARGRGVARRAVAAATTHAFTAGGVRRVRAGAAVDNAASRGVLEALGYRGYGVERLGALVRTGRADLALYDVLDTEWAALPAGSRRSTRADHTSTATPSSDSPSPTSAGDR